MLHKKIAEVLSLRALLVFTGNTTFHKKSLNKLDCVRAEADFEQNFFLNLRTHFRFLCHDSPSGCPLLRPGVEFDIYVIFLRYVTSVCRVNRLKCYLN